MAADLAVIVTARNEADRLEATLRALPDGEIWVADDASEDATAAVAARAGARVVTAPKRLGKGGAATLAAEALLRERDPVVLLADADLGDSAAMLRALVDAVSDGGPGPDASPDAPDASAGARHGPDAEIAADL